LIRTFFSKKESTQKESGKTTFFWRVSSKASLRKVISVLGNGFVHHVIASEARQSLEPIAWAARTI
jgi:hypothetical protein